MKSKTLYNINLALYFGLFIITTGIRYVGTPPEAFTNANDVVMMVYTSAILALIEYLVFFSWNLGGRTLIRYQEEHPDARMGPLLITIIVGTVVAFIALYVIL